MPTPKPVECLWRIVIHNLTTTNPLNACRRLAGQFWLQQTLLKVLGAVVTPFWQAQKLLKSCKGGISSCKYYSLSTGIATVKTVMTILYRLSTSFVVVKAVLENICRSCSNFVVVKTGLSNFYRPSTGFGEVQQASFDYRISCWRSVEVWQPYLNVLVTCSGLCDTF